MISKIFGVECFSFSPPLKALDFKTRKTQLISAEDATNYFLREINGSIYMNSSICRTFISSALRNKLQLIMNFHFYLARRRTRT